MSTDIIKCQKKYIFFKSLKSKQCEGAGEGFGGGSLDSFYVEWGILFLFLSTLICARQVFLEPHCSQHHKAFLKTSSLPSVKSWAQWRLSASSLGDLSGAPTERMRCWGTRAGAEGEVGTLCLTLFLLSGQDRDGLALKWSGHNPRTGMWASCASIYTPIS